MLTQGVKASAVPAFGDVPSRCQARKAKMSFVRPQEATLALITAVLWLISGTHAKACLAQTRSYWKLTAALRTTGGHYSTVEDDAQPEFR